MNGTSAVGGGRPRHSRAAKNRLRQTQLALAAMADSDVDDDGECVRIFSAFRI